MGAFFTNVQVHLGGLTPAEARARVVEAVRRLARSDGFVELPGPGHGGTVAESAVDPDAGRPDRAILVGPAGPTPWIAVYDEATDGQNAGELTRLTEALSAAGAGLAVGILDHDSDVLQLQLGQAGQTIDRFNNRPDYFGRISAAERGRLRGRAELWQSLLVGGATVGALREAWDRQPVFCEDQLLAIAGLVGFDPVLCQTGWRYLQRDDDPAIDQASFLRLAFRSANQPAYQEKSAGPPRLVPAGASPRQRLAVGQSGPLAHAGVRSEAGAGQGLYVVVWGDAIDHRLVQPTTAQLVKLVGRRPEVREAPLVARQDQSTTVYSATLPDFQLPAGLANPAALFSLTPGQSTPQALEAWTASQFAANILGQVLATGQAELHVGLAPLENFEAGQTSVTVRLEISAP
jgi:hypothetical protein